MTRTVRTVYRVLPPMYGQWELYRGRTKVGRFDDKATAVAEGRRLAHENTPSQLVVHTANGEIEDEITFPEDSVPHGA
ncbi:MAG: DUF2188 domain-containing protein [Acidimicrobiales bacterium]